MKRILIIVIILCSLGVGIANISGQPSKSDFMKSELNKIEQYLIHRDSLDKEVSKVAVAWHLDHSLKVINAIYDSLQHSDPSAYKKSFNMARTLSFTFGYIPRGRAQSPKSVLPPDTIKTDDIVSQLAIARNKLLEWIT